MTLPKPKVPNFVPGVGRLVTTRHQFEEHILGTEFRQTAGTVDMSPIITIGSNMPTNVQDAIAALAGAAGPTVPQATVGTSLTNLGVITLGGDLSGVGTTALSPKVGAIQGRPISSTAPTSGQVLTWSGSAWAPAGSSAFTPGGDLTGNGIAQYVVSLSGANGAGGAITISPISFLNSSTNQPVLKTGGTTLISIDSSGNLVLNGATKVSLSSSTVAATSLAGFGAGFVAVNNSGVLSFVSGIAPSGSAGGDLTGSYPNPTIAKLQGITVSAGSPSLGQVLEYNGTNWVPATVSGTSVERAYFGTGVDGTLHFDGSSTVLGMVPVANVYTFIGPSAPGRPIHPSNMTVDPGVTIKMSGFAIFCNGTLTNNGHIDVSGPDASGTTQGTALSWFFYGCGSNGGISSGGNGQTFSPTIGLGGTGGTGGAGVGGGGGVGGVTGGGTTLGGSFSLATYLSGFISFMGSPNDPTGSLTTVMLGGGSGGGGGGINMVGGQGGGGGAGGGYMLITAFNLTGSGTFTANGGAGGTVETLGVGGGGGGGGGLINIVYGTLGGTLAYQAAGGAGGTGPNAVGSTGGNGLVLLIQG